MDNIKNLIRLDVDTGNLYWKHRDSCFFNPTGSRSAEGCRNNWNSRYAGKQCLTSIGGHGYKRGNFLGKSLLAHRAVFFIYYGYMPKYVDHINGNKLDNRPQNLRAATNGQNIANSKSRVGSTSKYLGVCWGSNQKKWIATITKDGISKHIGVYDDEKLAALAYNRMAKIKHGEYARLNNVDGQS